MAVEWTDELKQQVIETYQDQNPTPENSMEIVKEIADGIGATPNGVHMILSKAEVYVKKQAPKTTEKSSGGPKRKGKAEAIEELKEAISAQGVELDESILDKLTGKAAVYFTKVVQEIAGTSTETEED